MKREVSSEHPIRGFFADALHDSLEGRLGIREFDVESYLADLLVRFVSLDGLYSVRDERGRPVKSISEMMERGDVRLKAESFEQERQVHRHIGDFLLFWSGLFPEFLKFIKTPEGVDALIDPVSQGRSSYYIASSFEKPPHEQEATVFRKLAERFEEFQYGLSLVRSDISTLGPSVWFCPPPM